MVCYTLHNIPKYGILSVMRKIKLHHPLADIQIKPLAVQHAMSLKLFILHALDDYVAEEGTISLNEIRNRMKKRHGDAFHTPGYYLRIYRNRADLTQVALAKKLNIKQHHLSEMEHNKRGIGKELAKKLAAILNCDYRKFL